MPSPHFGGSLPPLTRSGSEGSLRKRKNMTEQYGQRNINEQGDVVEFTATIAVPDVVLNPSVQMAQIDESLSGSTVTLPRATDAGQNGKITVVNLTGTNPVLVNVFLGDTLIAAPGVANPILVAVGTLTATADPDNDRWIVTAGTA